MEIKEKIQIHKYPAYKNSGEDFFGQVPVGWKKLPIYTVTKLKSITNCVERELLSVYLDKGVIKYSEVDQKRTNVTSTDLSKYQAVDPGDFVLNNQQAWRGSVGVSSYKGIVSPAYLVLSLSSELDNKYANYLFRDISMVSNYLICSKGVGTIQRNLYWPTLRRVNVVIPPILEQTAIANYLDEKCEKIDRTIIQKEKLIELLKERKQIIIQNAVTKGLDKDVKLKDSGVEWIGEIPEHWNILDMNFAINKVADVDHYMPPTKENGIPYVMTGDLEEFASKIDFDGCKKVSQRDYYNLTKKIKNSKGDVILARYATIGTACYIDVDFDFLVSYSCVTIKPNPSKLLGLYLFYYFKSAVFTIEIKNQANTNTQGNVGIDDFKRVKLVLPPINEQRKIIEKLQNENRKFNELVELQYQQIEKLKEYKSSLINSVVTGKIKVC